MNDDHEALKEDGYLRALDGLGGKFCGILLCYLDVIVGV